MCGQGCGQGACPAPRRSHGHCLVGLMADIPGTVPSPGAATGPHRVGVGGHSLQAGQTSQPPRLGRLATNFLLGPLRPRAASKSFLLPPLPPSLLIHTGMEVSVQALQKSLCTLSQRGPLKPRVSHVTPCLSRMLRALRINLQVLPLGSQGPASRGLFSHLLLLTHPSSHAGLFRVSETA